MEAPFSFDFSGPPPWSRRPEVCVLPICEWIVDNIIAPAVARHVAAVPAGEGVLPVNVRVKLAHLGCGERVLLLQIAWHLSDLWRGQCDAHCSKLMLPTATALDCGIALSGLDVTLTGTDNDIARVSHADCTADEAPTDLAAAKIKYSFSHQDLQQCDVDALFAPLRRVWEC